jgi:hypothetical protein
MWTGQETVTEERSEYTVAQDHRTLSPSNSYEHVSVLSYASECGHNTITHTNSQYSFDTDDTMSNLPGVGRCLGNFYSRSGRLLEQALGRLAHRCGYGPFAVGIRLSRLLYSMLGSFHVASWEVYVSGRLMERSIAPVIQHIQALTKYTK